MNIITRYEQDDLFISENEQGNEIIIDMRESSEKQRFGPVEMILAAIAGCVAVDIVSMIRKKRKTFVDLIIKTTGTRRETHPRGLTHIHSSYILISPDTSLSTFEKVASLATEKYCSVAASVSAEVTFTCEVRPS